MTQTTEGVGSGAVDNILGKIFNGVVKSENISPSNVEYSDLSDNSVTTDKIVDGAVTLNKISSGIVSHVQGGLWFPNDVIYSDRIKVRVVFSGSPDTSALQITGHGDFSPIDLMIAWKKVTSAGFDSGVMTQVADVSTWYTVESLNDDGEMLELFVGDRSFHSSYRVTMQVRQSNVGDTHLVVERLVPEDVA